MPRMRGKAGAPTQIVSSQQGTTGLFKVDPWARDRTASRFAVIYDQGARAKRRNQRDADRWIKQVRARKVKP